MLNIHILGFKAIRQAQFDVAGVTLIGGHNMAGKSSLLRGVASVLARNWNAYGIGSEKEAKELLTDGEDLASITVKGPGGAARYRWPKNEGIKEEGSSPPQATEIATGAKPFTKFKAEDRAKLLVNYLDAMPTKEDFVAAATEIGIAETAMPLLWEAIEADGWDTLYSRRRDRGTEIRGAWQKHTSKNFGKNVAQTWEPEGWTDDLRKETEATLHKIVGQRVAEYEQALKTSAVAAADFEQVQKLAALLDERDKAVRDAEAAGTTKTAEVEEARTAIGQLKMLVEPTQGCPHCGKALMIDGQGAIVKPGKAIPEDQARMNATRLEQWNKALIERQTALEEARTDYRAKKEQWLESHTAKNRVDAAIKAGGEGGEVSSEEQVQAARALKDVAEARLRLWTAWSEGQKLYQQWFLNDRLCDMLAPDGLRQIKLASKMAGFNDRLAQISTAFRQRPVRVADDMRVFLENRRFTLLSESEQWRVDLVLQIAFAEIDTSPVILVDRLDVLNKVWKERVIGGMVALKIQAIVCMAANSPDLVPDLDRYGGRTYWVQDETVITRTAAIEAKAAAKAA